MLVPAKAFFTLSDLWWNGKNGYKNGEGKNVFFDPSTAHYKSRALIADIDELLRILERQEQRLIWTLLGEKWILGGRHDTPSPRRTFSQIALLEKDGSIKIGDRVFFDNYDKDTEPFISLYSSN